MNIRKLILVGLLCNITSMHAQTLSRIPIKDGKVAIELQNALKSPVYNNRLNSILQFLNREEKASFKSYDDETQQAYILTLMELFNQRLKNPRTRNSATGTFFKFMQKAALCSILDTKNIGADPDPNHLWFGRLNKMLLDSYLGSTEPTTSQILGRRIPPSLTFNASIVDAVRQNAKYGMDAEGGYPDRGQTIIQPPPTGSQTTSQNVIVMKKASPKANKQARRRCKKAEKKKQAKTKILIASKLMLKAFGKMYKDKTQNTFVRVVIDIFNNRAKVKNVKMIKKFFKEVLNTSLLADNQKNAVKTKMLPAINALKKRKKARKKSKRERKILKILKKLKNKRKGR